jgi:replicative DNA helicase
MVTASMEPQPPSDGPPPELPPEHAGALATGPEGIALPPAPPSSGGPPTGPATQAASLSTSLNPRLAPQDIEAERSVLGGVLLTNDALFDVAEIVKPDDFYREQHRKIFTSMQDLSFRNEPIDVITLADELRKKGELEAVGGPSYISSLDAFVPATANLSRYAKIVRDKALARRLIEAAHGIAREGYEQLGNVDELLDSAEQQIFDVTEKKQSQAFVALKDTVKRVFANLESLYEKQTDITGIATGFDMLDRMTAGFQRGDLIIVAGRPSMGKTSVVMNMAAHVAIEKAMPVAVFSLEMSADALTTRLFSSEARVDGQRLRNGKLLDSDWPKLARAADRLHRAPMFIDDSAGLSALEMRAKCRRLKAKHNDLGLVVVDYLQLMKGRAESDSREQEISDISRGLKALAKELQVPVIALSQLNRSLERREDKRPQLSDLRESGAIEQDADLICFIYRDEVYNKESADKGIAEIIIGKQRNGPTGAVRVAFLRDYTRFENLSEEQSFRDAE